MLRRRGVELGSMKAELDQDCMERSGAAGQLAMEETAMERGRARKGRRGRGRVE